MYQTPLYLVLVIQLHMLESTKTGHVSVIDQMNNNTDITSKAENIHEVPSFKVPRKRYPCSQNNTLCLCDGSFAICMNHGHQLKYIPKLPKRIKVLNFTGNYLPYMNKTTVESLTSLHLISLGLKANSLESCESTTFSELRYISSFILSNERMTSSHLISCLRSIMHVSLRKLYLFNLDLTDGFPSDFFSDIVGRNSKIVSINMDGTHIKLYNQTTFAPFKHLQRLSLSNCGLYETYLEKTHTLKWLTLTFNQLTTFPSLCRDNEAMLPELTVLELDHNYINHIPSHKIQCMKALRNISITNNPIHIIEANTFSGLSSLRSLFIEYNSDNHLLIQAFAFNSSSLLNLFLSHNKLYSKNTSLSLDAFKYCKQLTTLILDYNIIHTSEESFNVLLGSLPNLRELSVSGTGLTYLPMVIPKYMTKLEKLYVFNNYISSWPEGYFQNMTSLKELEMARNQISVITKTSFSEENLKTFVRIDFSKNPYSCNCDLVWFIEYLNEHRRSKKIDYYPSNYTCNTPPKLHKTQLNKVPLTEHLCLVHKISEVIVYVSSTVIFIVFLFLVVYRYRWHLRYWIYMIRFHQLRYQRLLQGQEYEHDLYLSSSEDDFDFIYGQIVPRLEDELGQRLYIPQRDGTGSKIDGIISNMNVSRKTVLFVSDSYARDNYCEFEASLAYDSYVSERRNMMIVVVLEEMDAINVNKTLHKILKVDEYIKWGWTEESIRLFWIRLADIVKDDDDMWKTNYVCK